MLHALPSPGSPQFANLARALQPFGLDARGITFEVPSARMADVSLNLALLRGEIRLQITYEGFEIVAAQLVDEHLAVIPRVAGVAREALQGCFADGAGGHYEITYSAHLGLEPGKAALILAEHLPSKAGDQHLVPDGFAYRIQHPDCPDVVTMRLVVMQSLRLKEAIYVEFTAVYQGELPVEALTNKAVEDTVGALARLGLKNEQGGAK